MTHEPLSFLILPGRYPEDETIDDDKGSCNEKN